MKTLLRLLPLLLVIALAACSGSGTPATDADAGNDTGDAPATEADGGTDTGDGGDDPDGTTSEGFNLCDVISTDEVGEIVGVEVTDTTAADLQGVVSCNYNDADGLAVAGMTLALDSSAVDVQQLFDAYRDDTENEEIPDLGDGAVMAGSEDFPILAVMVNGNLYSLSVLADNLDAAGKREATIELARQSIDRLP